MSQKEALGDALLEELASLGTHEPDGARDRLVRARCRAGFDGRRRQPHPVSTPEWRRGLESAIVGTLCAVYLLEVLTRAVHLYRF